MRTSPADRIARWERGTRRWARAGAVVMLLGVFLSVVHVGRGGDVGWGWDAVPSTSPAVPHRIGMALLAVAVWFLAARTNLVRRGAALVATVGLGGALFS